MIARIWKGETEASEGDTYLEYMEETGLADYRKADGNEGVFVLRRERDGRAEFLLLTLWDGMDSIRRFAGSQPERARYYPEDKRFLLHLRPEVEHWDLVQGEDPEVGS
jgi:heme-degrading monooxygenase HmoA